MSALLEPRSGHATSAIANGTPAAPAVTAPATSSASIPAAGLVSAVRPTTIVDAIRLKPHVGPRILLATETFQFTGSFKFRAALNVALSVPHPRILTASSGNFGQGLACACALTGKKSVIVMPHTSAQIKVDGVRFYGGLVDLVDTRLTSRAARVAQLRAEYPEAYVASPFDDPLVIAGNSSLGHELGLRLDPACTAIVSPIGGGGLVSGLIEGLRRAERPLTVYGAEPALANDAARSFRAGHIISNSVEPPTMADGARTLSIGAHNWPIMRDGLEDILEVPEQAIAEAVRLLFVHAHLKAEPTGALSLAAVLANPDRFRDHDTVCCVVSGGNVDSDVYRQLLSDGPILRTLVRTSPGYPS
jgi:threonine dehydratase